ncbi:MAG: hypothetical protein IPK50_04275 [Fibrobacterota bacterium]|nr:MAG: hypothetical protein IPK50_04275 [Fibrobacterota bacterium]
MIPVHSITASLLLLVAGLAQAQTIVPAEVSPKISPIGLRLVSPSDTARVSFTVLHTKARNWLQTQIEPVGACQYVFVDSVSVLDSAAVTGGIQTVYLDGAPRRNVRIWWGLYQKASDSRCTSVTSARNLMELPNPHRSPRTDSLLTSWAPDQILATASNGRIDSGYPQTIDQAGDLERGMCPLYDCMMMCLHPESAAREAFLATMREQLAKGLPVVRITGAGPGIRVNASIDDTSAVRRLGPMSKWRLGNLAWGEDQPIRTVRSWGAAAPAQWLKTSGKRIYRWRNDTLASAISANGATVEVSNDSTFECERPDAANGIDRGLASDLARDWLIAPDSSEVRDGRLRSTFRHWYCGGRERSWEIHGDSITVGCARVALSDLEQTLGTAPRNRLSKLLIMANATGLRVQPGLATGTPWSMVVRDASGRILTQRDSREFEETIPLAVRGILVVEIRSAIGATTRMVAR